MAHLFEVRDGNRSVGSFSGDQIRQHAADGTLNGGMQIRRLPDGTWAPLSNVKGLQFKSPTATATVAAAVTPPVSPSPVGERGRRNRGVVLFACSAAAVTLALAGGLLFREFGHDRWETFHSTDCIQRLDEADKLRETDPLAAPPHLRSRDRRSVGASDQGF
jgi:hypothetical protein